MVIIYIYIYITYEHVLALEIAMNNVEGVQEDHPLNDLDRKSVV